MTGIVSGGLDEPTITLIIAIVIAILTAGFFIIRLEVRVKNLEEDPFLAGIKEVHKDDAIGIIGGYGYPARYGIE